MRTDIYQFEDLSMAILGQAREGELFAPDCTPSASCLTHQPDSQEAKGADSHHSVKQDHAACLLQRVAAVLKVE